MNNIYRNIAVLAAPFFIALGIIAVTALPVGASPASEVRDGIKATGDTDTGTCGPNKDRKCTIGDSIATITNVLLFIIGTVAVIMIIIGGIRYTTSNGDASQVTAAKNTILYAVIGIIVALLAYAVVNFVVERFAK